MSKCLDSLLDRERLAQCRAYDKGECVNPRNMPGPGDLWPELADDAEDAVMRLDWCDMRLDVTYSGDWQGVDIVELHLVLADEHAVELPLWSFSDAQIKEWQGDIERALLVEHSNADWLEAA